jgi:hypothetical protein
VEVGGDTSYAAHLCTSVPWRWSLKVHGEQTAAYQKNIMYFCVIVI